MVLSRNWSMTVFAGVLWHGDSEIPGSRDMVKKLVEQVSHFIV